MMTEHDNFTGSYFVVILLSVADFVVLLLLLWTLLLLINWKNGGLVRILPNNEQKFDIGIEI